MRYRKMSADGDYLFGSRSSWLINSPEAVAQAVLTRLRLYAREWFLDQRAGTDLDLILGAGTQGTRDFEIRRRILGTPGVRSIVAYSSTMEGRDFQVSATIDTIYGQITIQESIT